MRKNKRLFSISEKTVRPSRVVIAELTPMVESDVGRFDAKCAVGQTATISATLLCDGHDQIKAWLAYKHKSAKKWSRIKMTPQGNDIWTCSIAPSKMGYYECVVEADIDRFSTWKKDLLKRLAANQSVENDLAIGQKWLAEMKTQANSKADKAILGQVSSQIGELRERFSTEELHQVLENRELLRVADAAKDAKSFVKSDKKITFYVDPPLGEFSAWYEFFPRSCGSGLEHGTFKDCESHLPMIKSMGFDIVYLPPIHPIGKTHRKGKNNSLVSHESDVGSPWAIGSANGGHKAIHPQLGSFSDFESFVHKANELGMKVALDIAFQCSPDHPYVTEHPEWFKKRQDGSIQYAENPPKKYEDIYPFDFECDQWRDLWKELHSIFLFWIKKGVSVFRVDNPHTKPFHFWDWLINDLRAKYPETIFLSEAFTRPHITQYLAKIGFNQSYTYFTWRNTPKELQNYVEELVYTDLIDYFRPNFWPNTPDILNEFLVEGGPPAFRIRSVLASMLSSCWGLYGPAFEMMDNTPRETGSEEYLDSEKYEIKHWNLDSEESLRSFISRLNQIRCENPALQSNRRLMFHSVTNDRMIAFSKSTEDLHNIILVIVNMDPYEKQVGEVDFAIHEYGLAPGVEYRVRDLISEDVYSWVDWRNYVELSPDQSAHIFIVERM